MTAATATLDPPAVKTEIGLITSIEEITPAIAEAWLGRNAHNRNTNWRRVHQLADAMKRGEWALNGESIKIDINGNLLDGQHRLEAVKESGVTIRTMVVRNLPIEVQETIDIGRPRRVGDMLKIRGELHYATLGAALNQRFTFINYGFFGEGGSPATPQQLLDLLEREPKIRDWINTTENFCRRFKFPNGMATAMWYSFAQVDLDSAIDFADRLDTGADLKRGSPILDLRDVFLADLLENRPMRPRWRAELTIRTWNALRRGEQRVQLRGRLKQFPKPI